MGVKGLFNTIGFGIRSMLSIIFVGCIPFILVVLLDIWNSGEFISILLFSCISAVVVFYGVLFLLDTLIVLCDLLLSKLESYSRESRLK